MSLMERMSLVKREQEGNKRLKMNPDETMLRPLELDDVARCVALANALPESFNEKGLRSMAPDLTRLRGWVASRDGDVRAFIAVGRRYDGVAEIAWLAVEAGFQRRGVGSALVNAALAGLAADGVRLVTVKTLAASVVSASYDGARHFYQSLGFLLIEEIDPLPGWEPGNPCALYARCLCG